MLSALMARDSTHQQQDETKEPGNQTSKKCTLFGLSLQGFVAGAVMAVLRQQGNETAELCFLGVCGFSNKGLSSYGRFSFAMHWWVVILCSGICCHETFHVGDL